MFSEIQPYSFHIELTDKCNAGCPMCSRTDPMDFCRPNPDKVRKIELTLADFHEHFPPEFCSQVDEVQFGGGLGDALAARECLEICEYLTGHGVRLIVSTNGGLRNTRWWTRLGEAMRRTGSHVELHVDGLADTNPLYRVNTSFDKIMDNARAYLATGAVADWYYILFRHNEHQVAEARALAREMGFREFVLIDTIRFGRDNRFAYRMPGGETRHLEPATLTSADFKARFAQKDPATATPSPRPSPAPAPPGSPGARAAAGVNGIRCKSQIFNRPYITADGNVSPCCWIALSDEELDQIRLAGRAHADLNIRNRPLREILQDEPFASLYEQSWIEDRGRICQRKRGAGRRNKRHAV